MRLLEEIRDGIPGEELIGPAPLLRLRGRQRAQLVAKSASRAVSPSERPSYWPPPLRPCAAPI